MKRCCIGLLVPILLCGVGCGKKKPDLRFDGNMPAGQFAGGTDALDYVLADAESEPFENLFTGANTAYGLGRLEDAAFLLYVGRIRAKYDFERFQPTETGGDSPKVYAAFLHANISEAINHDLFLLPAGYRRVIDRVAAWNLNEAADFKRDWNYTLAPVSSDLASKLRREFVEPATTIAVLLNVAEFFEAFKAYCEFNHLPPDEQSGQAKQRHRDAIGTMLRIEKEKNLPDIFGLDRDEP